VTAGGITMGVSYSSGVSGPYAICDKCHDLENTLVTQSGSADSVFHKHYSHVVTASAACSTCHASHGVQGATGVNNAHLVDFDTNVVGPDDQGRLYLDTGSRSCYLTCHGVIHNPKTY